jgi:hypothetical protein
MIKRSAWNNMRQAVTLVASMSLSIERAQEVLSKAILPHGEEAKISYADAIGQLLDIFDDKVFVEATGTAAVSFNTREEIMLSERAKLVAERLHKIRPPPSGSTIEISADTILDAIELAGYTLRKAARAPVGIAADQAPTPGNFEVGKANAER